ncbi:Retrovirus-related Pol polyprotein from transposon TNT 1-94 [Vitis vinifera]|uniref:Retrovirus-related Pol polyprotein from transposon TNT 1-94 n=1 Tax=Vitis vinifera TaxID=29760 RepID=A0A438JW69_VITVI|nr:Retrovirus-related Pol polyprotein from transposon TNT 1-94 [Vitis vinifera]
MRTDKGGEYYGRYIEDGQPPGLFAKFLQEHGIVARYTMPGSLDRNSVVERRNRTLMDMVRSMRSNSKLPKSLWTKALKTAVSILNRFQQRLSPRHHLNYGKVGPFEYVHLKLIFIHNAHQVQTGDGQPIIEVPQIAYDNPIDQVVQDSPKIVEQPVEQYDPQENVNTTLRRSTRARKTAIPSDCVVYL